MKVGTGHFDREHSVAARWNDAPAPLYPSALQAVAFRLNDRAHARATPYVVRIIALRIPHPFKIDDDYCLTHSYVLGHVNVMRSSLLNSSRNSFQNETSFY